MCEGKFDVIQGIQDAPLELCPWCGLEVRRVISKAVIKIGGTVADDKAGKKGFTTFRKAEKGVWEKVGGDGPDVLMGSKEDIAAVDAEKAPPKKVLDLDNLPD